MTAPPTPAPGAPFDLGLAGARAVVTGGSGAIGAAICRLLVEQGARVWSLDLGAPAEPVPGVRTLVTDVRSRASIVEAAAVIAILKKNDANLTDDERRLILDLIEESRKDGR